MTGEVVASRAYRAAPVLESKVHLAMRIQNCQTCFASHWLVLYNSHILNLFERGVHGSDWEHDSLLSDLIAGPVVPREADAILNFSLVEVHLCCTRF